VHHISPAREFQHERQHARKISQGGAYRIRRDIFLHLGLVWPSGWQWHGGEGKYYLQMICGVYAVLGAFLIAASREPSEHRSLISFTIWSSIVHAGIMAAQSISDGHETGHLVGDVPALLLVAAVLWFLSPAKQQVSVAT
jgi:hypothetical protein